MLFELNSTEIARWGSDTKWKEGKEFLQDSSVMFPIVESNLPSMTLAPLKNPLRNLKT